MSVHGLPTSTGVTHQTGTVDLPPTTTPLSQDDGLAQIQHQVDVRQLAVQQLPPPNGHPAGGLQQIMSWLQRLTAPAPPPDHQLDPLSGKSGQIRQGLTDSLSTQLDQRLTGMSQQERKDVKSLLHFPWYGRGDTTEASRVQIRTILASFIAQGGSVDDAKLLKTQLKGMDAARLPTVLADLNRLADPGRGIPAPQNQLLSDRLTNAGVAERQQMEALLSAPVDSTSVSQAAQRADIRTIMAACLAQGMGLHEADQLKTLLSTLPAQDLAAIRTEMAKPDAKAFAILSSFLLNTQAPDPGRFDQVRQMIQSFPPDVTRAGKTEHVDGNTTLVRDDHGRLDVAFASAGFVRIGDDDPYPPLSDHQKGQIETAFDNICSIRYGRMGVPLDMMGAFQAENNRRHQANEEPISLREFAQTWQADGSASMARYGKGDCMTTAQELVSDLARQGIKAYLGGVTNPVLMQQRNAGNGIPTDGRLNTQGITHTDVLVPYRTPGGEDRVILITPGMGNLDKAKFFKDLPANDPEVAKDRVAVSQDLDPGKIQKDQLGFLTNLQINDRAWDNPTHCLLGLDLVKGTIGLSSAATTRFREAHGTDFAPDQTTLVFNYRDALADPTGRVTVKVWNDVRQDYEDQSITKLESLTLFLRALQDQFNQPDDFVTNALALMSHEREYHSDILWQTTRDLNEL